MYFIRAQLTDKVHQGPNCSCCLFFKIFYNSFSLFLFHLFGAWTLTNGTMHMYHIGWQKLPPALFFFFQLRFPTFHGRKDTVPNMFLSILFIELSIVHVLHYFSFAQVIDKSFSGSMSAAMSKRNRFGVSTRVATAWTTPNGLFWNRNRCTLQAQKPLYVHSGMFLPVLMCSFWVFSV